MHDAQASFPVTFWIQFYSALSRLTPITSSRARPNLRYRCLRSIKAALTQTRRPRLPPGHAAGRARGPNQARGTETGPQDPERSAPAQRMNDVDLGDFAAPAGASAGAQSRFLGGGRRQFGAGFPKWGCRHVGVENRFLRPSTTHSRKQARLRRRPLERVVDRGQRTSHRMPALPIKERLSGRVLLFPVICRHTRAQSQDDRCRRRTKARPRDQFLRVSSPVHIASSNPPNTVTKTEASDFQCVTGAAPIGGNLGRPCHYYARGC